MGKILGKRERQKIIDDRTKLVEQALDLGKLTKTGICDATGIKMTDLNNLFTKNRDLYAKYVVLRRTVKDVAADNIVSIVMDKKHPKNYDASKEILKNFKTDLDEVLDQKDGSEIQIQTKGGAKSPVKIVFKNTSSNKDEK